MVRETRTPEASEEEVPGGVAGEDPAGAVPSVRGRGQADDQEPGARIAERRKRAPPVTLAAKARGRMSGSIFPPGHEPRAAPAADDLPGQLREGVPHIRVDAFRREASTVSNPAFERSSVAFGPVALKKTLP